MHPFVQARIAAVSESVIGEALGFRRVARYGVQVQLIAKESGERAAHGRAARARRRLRVRGEVTVEVARGQASFRLADVQRLVEPRLELEIAPRLLVTKDGVQTSGRRHMNRSFCDRPPLRRERFKGVRNESLDGHRGLVHEHESIMHDERPGVLLEHALDRYEYPGDMARMSSAAAAHIGARISTARKNRSMSVDELAVASKIDSSNIRGYEAGRALMNVQSLVRIAEALEVEAGVLLEGVSSAMFAQER